MSRMLVRERAHDTLWQQSRRQRARRAYVLFDVEPTTGGFALERLTHHSLGGCNLRASEIFPDEIIAHLGADGLESFNAALVELLREAGVRRATTLRIPTIS